MSSKKTDILASLIPLIVVACISLTIVSGVVIWIAARGETGVGEMAAALLSGRQSARPVPRLTSYDALADTTPYRPTHTPQPSPTPMPADNVVTGETVVGTVPAPRPTRASSLDTPSPTESAPSAPSATPTLQIETAIESPIRAGSPLPERPATRLVIPTMELDVPVVMSNIENQTWRVDHLGKEFVGHLEGTASPGDPSNVVLAGHVTIAHNVYGPFAGLGQLEPGDPIVVYAGDRPYTYIVDYRQLVSRTDVSVAYPTDTGRVTLITCSNWSDELGVYQERLIVVGHLAEEGS